MGLLFPFFLLIAIACDNGVDGDPIGPSNVGGSSQVTVTPTSITVTKGQQLTFTANGGTPPFSWGVSNTSFASIITDTGVFTAGTTPSSVSVIATDTNGSKGEAQVTITNKSLTVFPGTAQVGKLLTQQFTATGQTDPVFWSVSNTSFGSIDVNTGLFTAGVNEGAVTITALDADGDTATASVTVIANTIIVTPVSSGPFTAAVVQPLLATTNGVAATYTWTLSGETNDYSGGTLTVSAIPTVGTSLTVTQPTSDEGDQTLTVTATDGNGDTGTATVNLTAASAN